ncbi:helix-turn-helix domain-containing protein [Saccharothrix deserti]|uniref:helix-turn-helix domain-containing protein n=1 Tax=Saccharothrix deserti TaxID=2593674 RepID=UPI00131AEE2C|nr:helix-turn-helix domain-containing protein [Saccharothrix deserti]
MTAKNTAAILALVAQLTTLLAEEQTESRDVSSVVPKATAAPSNRVLLTTEEAAERLGVGRTTMYRLIGTGEIESVQIGRLRRIHVAAVDAYARKLLQNPDAA